MRYMVINRSCAGGSPRSMPPRTKTPRHFSLPDKSQVPRHTNDSHTRSELSLAPRGACTRQRGHPHRRVLLHSFSPRYSTSRVSTRTTAKAASCRQCVERSSLPYPTSRGSSFMAALRRSRRTGAPRLRMTQSAAHESPWLSIGAQRLSRRRGPFEANPKHIIGSSEQVAQMYD